MKNYNAYDLSRKRYMEERIKKKREIQAKRYEGYYVRDCIYSRTNGFIPREPYIKRSGKRKCYKDLKRESVRAVRRSKTIVGNRGYYRKMYDLWWNYD